MHCVHCEFQFCGPSFQLPSTQSSQRPRESEPQLARIWPPGQLAQSTHALWPCASWYRPVEHAAHEDWPSVAANLPAAHFTHGVFH